MEEMRELCIGVKVCHSKIFSSHGRDESYALVWGIMNFE
jgi:hypothetical protein